MPFPAPRDAAPVADAPAADAARSLLAEQLRELEQVFFGAGGQGLRLAAVVVAQQGVELVGRLVGVRDLRLQLSGSLANLVAGADLKQSRLLDQIDEAILGDDAPDESGNGVCEGAKSERYIDANGYSLRVGGTDLATSYRLIVRSEATGTVLVALPTKSGAGPEMVVARSGGPIGGFHKLEPEPGWRLMRRTYGGRRLGHLYVYSESWPLAATYPCRLPP